MCNTVSTRPFFKMQFLKRLFVLAFFTLGFSLPSSLWAQDSAAGSPAAAVAPAVSGGGDAAAIAKGEAVFAANCKQCHAINEVVVGPALKGVTGRWPSEAALANFIKYPQKTIDGGNAYAKGLYDKYKQYMPNHDFLSDADIKAVIEYVKVEGDKPAVAAGPAAPAAGSDAATTTTAAADGGSTTLLLTLVVIVLMIMLVVLVLMVNILTKNLASNTEVTEDERVFVTQKTDYLGFFSTSSFKVIATVSLLLIIGKAGYDKVYGIGIAQGYAPKQPIAFSHKLHAGMYEMECNYCHTGVNKGKAATIPSVNICMNCHNAIKTESKEIQKLYTAIEKNRPIEWVRVHNLPDLAYFNHAQHVKVGKVECQTCHGAIQEMEVVQQHSTLTMGWCINCHRQTAVKAEGNAYYDKLVYLHKQTKKGEMKVADIGGLECSKCHY